MQSLNKKKPTQLTLQLPGHKRGKLAKEYGGEDHAKRHVRKTERPFDPEKSLHITLRAKNAMGSRSMLRPDRIKLIKIIIFTAAKKHGVVIRKYVCVGNHLHLLIYTHARRIQSARPALRSFLRQISGLIARLMTGAKKGAPAQEKFWDHLAWSRIVSFGRDLAILNQYMKKNACEMLLLLQRYDWFEAEEFATGPP